MNVQVCINSYPPQKKKTIAFNSSFVRWSNLPNISIQLPSNFRPEILQSSSVDPLNRRLIESTTSIRWDFQAQLFLGDLVLMRLTMDSTPRTPLFRRISRWEISTVEPNRLGRCLKKHTKKSTGWSRVCLLYELTCFKGWWLKEKTFF